MAAAPAIDFSRMTPAEFRHAKANMTREDKKTYYVSLCAQPPDLAFKQHMSRKGMKYQQCMALKQRKGDSMLSAMHNGHQDPKKTPLQPADHMCNMQVPE